MDKVLNTPDILKRILNYLMRLIPLYDGEEIVGEVPCIENLDQWDGTRWCFRRPGDHIGVGKLEDGRYYACYSTEYPEGIVRNKLSDEQYEIIYGYPSEKAKSAIVVVISEEEAKEMVKKYGKGKYKAIFGEET